MRLIDADALKEKSHWECYNDLDYDYEYVLVTDIDRAPTIDAVPIVRCKDCKHNSLKRMSGNTYCDLGMGLFQLYDFCSKGERRTNATLN